MAMVKMRTPNTRPLLAGTIVTAYGYSGEIDDTGYAVVMVPQHLAENEAVNGRLVMVDKPSVRGESNSKADAKK